MGLTRSDLGSGPQYHVVGVRGPEDRLILETYRDRGAAERRAAVLGGMLEGYEAVEVECDTGTESGGYRKQGRPVGVDWRE